MSLTRYRIRKTRERIREEAKVLEAVSARLRALHVSIPAPSIEELHAMEEGDAPLSLEAIWISILREQESVTEDSASRLLSAAHENRPSKSFYPRRPSAKFIAHLRAALRGRTLPENFKPEFADVPVQRLLRGHFYSSRNGVLLVSDLLMRGYSWE